MQGRQGELPGRRRRLGVERRRPRQGASKPITRLTRSTPRAPAKVKDGLQQISDFCSQVGNTGIDTGEYVGSRRRLCHWLSQAQSEPRLRAQAAIPRCSTMPVTCARWTVRRNPASFVTGCRVPQEGDRPGLYRRGGQYLLLPLPLLLRTEERAGQGFPREGQAGPADGYREVPEERPHHRRSGAALYFARG